MGRIGDIGRSAAIAGGIRSRLEHESGRKHVTGTAAYLDDMARLNVSPPDIAPHVTDHMEAIVAQIGAIIVDNTDEIDRLERLLNVDALSYQIQV